MHSELIFWLVTLAIVPSAFVAWLVVFFVRRKAHSWGLVDQPGERKVHETPTPMGGGIAIWAAVLIPMLLGTTVVLLNGSVADYLPDTIRPYLAGVEEQLGDLWILLSAGSLMMILGFMDDRKGLSWKTRLFVQFVVAVAVVSWQGWTLTAFIPYRIITILISAVWIVSLINSFNMLDNMDGASAGVAAIASTFLAVYVLLPGATPEGPQVFIAGFLFVFVGALGGFLIHNRPPASIFMGDAGSYFVGFCIAVTTLLATYTDARAENWHGVLAPLCILAVPLYDMVTVILIRIREGRSPFQADKCHFSHRLVELGLSKPRAVLTMYLTTATCGLAGLLLQLVSSQGAILVVLVVLFILLIVAILESTARRKVNSVK